MVRLYSFLPSIYLSVFKVQSIYRLGCILNRSKDSNHKAQMCENPFQVQGTGSNTPLFVSTCTHQAL